MGVLGFKRITPLLHHSSIPGLKQLTHGSRCDMEHGPQVE